ncbi:SAM-dependent methyltransferase [Actinobacteria bacterium IMCC25003]|nr:SAM-dependent methyltransferase [Actinobacteria bacterium IMCC25003]
MNKILRFLKALVKLAPRETWGNFVQTSEIAGFSNAFSISWSQGGEDLALLHAIAGKRDGLFIDVGAHHPYRFSVTHHLSRIGWRGVNIDANSELIETFNKERKRDINICAAVGTEKSYTFTIFKEPALSSVIAEWKDKFQADGWEVDRTVTVPGISLREIYNQNFPRNCIDLLSIDAEGSDFNVLKSMDFESLEKDRFPRFLLLEATPPVSSALKTDSVEYAIGLGYEPLYVLPMSTLLKRS